MPALQLPITELDICIKQGETFSQVLYYEDGTPLAPVNISGYTGKLQIRHREGSKAVLLTLTNGSGLTLGADGSITIAISATNTSSLQTSDNMAIYDLKLTSGSGVVSRIFQGKVIISPQVTV